MSATPRNRSGRRRGRLFRVRDWRVRTKLAAVLTIPALAFLVIAGLEISSSVQQATTLRQFTDHVALDRQVTALVHQLQRERDQTSGALAVQGIPRQAPAALLASRTDADRAAADLRQAAQPLLDNPDVRSAYDKVAASLNAIGRVRTGVTDGWLRKGGAFDAYSQCIADLLDLMAQPSPVVGDERLARTVRASLDLAAAKELESQVRGQLFGVLQTNIFLDNDFSLLADARADRGSEFARFRTDATPQQLARYDELVRGQAVRAAGRIEDEAVERARATRIDLNPTEWWQASTARLELMRAAETDLVDDAIRLARSRDSAQQRTTVLATAAIVLILFVALLMSWTIGRSMALSLRTLRIHALDVAQHQLPDALERIREESDFDPIHEVPPAALQTGDEMGEVAEAFTAVHTSAMRLATEQALMRRAVNAMFVNLARRSQTLVERQLQLLDGLEASETDPEQLSILFRLDHLATRMRRNDENLLVLAGSDTARRWSEPVALSSVILAAMAEIEQYPRIRRNVSDDVYIVGHAVADVVHLLAELLENATMFSSPDTEVQVSGWRHPEGGGATVTVEDHGMGMSENTYAEANYRLGTATPIDVAASERMGLVVVGNLAARHGIRVDLRPASDGVAAQVLFPAKLLAAPPTRRPEIGGGEMASVVRGSVLPVTEALPTIEPAPTIESPVVEPRAVEREVDSRAADSRDADSRDAEPRVGESRGAELRGVESRGAEPPVVDAGAEGVPEVEEPTVKASTTNSKAAKATGKKGRGRGSRGSTNPRRAEDVLGAGSEQSGAGTRWWSRSGPPATGTEPAPAPEPRTPVTAGTSLAGLPIRVPMAQLPNDSTAPERTQTDSPVAATYSDPDPSSMGSVLSRFYGGVHRAAAESDDAAPVTSED